MTAMFEGVYCPSITICNDDGDLDFELWGRHLDHLVQAGINGVLLFGSIGEFYAYTLEQKKEVVKFAVEHVAGRMKVLVGVGDTNIDNVLELSRYCEQVGADAVVAVEPYYFGPSEAAALRYFEIVAESTSLPVVLYNFPARTGAEISPQLVVDLIKTHSNIVGIKDTVDNISHARKIVAAVRQIRPDFSVLSGYDEYYLPNRVCGGSGVLCGLTNVEPETFSRMHHAYQSGDYSTAVAAAQRISHLMAIYDCADLFIAAIKGAVKVVGLPISTAIREPAVQVDDTQLRRIRQLLES